jgi:hypothetical protein
MEEISIPIDAQSQQRNIKNVKKGSMIPPKVHNSLATNSKDTEMGEMPEN